MTDQKHKIKAAAYAILERDGKILFQRRENTGFMDGLLGLPAGHMELNESTMDCMIREAEEEVGIQIHPSDAKCVFVAHRFEPSGEYDYVDFYFSVSKWQGKPRVNEPDKASEIVWLALNEDDNNIVPYLKKHLLAIRAGELHQSTGRKVEEIA